MRLSQESATRLAKIPLACLQKEFPNKLNQVLGDHDELILNAENHFNASFPHLSSGNYEGEHWLTSFAILAITLKP